MIVLNFVENNVSEEIILSTTKFCVLNWLFWGNKKGLIILIIKQKYGNLKEQ